MTDSSMKIAEACQLRLIKVEEAIRSNSCIDQSVRRFVNRNMDGISITYMDSVHEQLHEQVYG